MQTLREKKLERKRSASSHNLAEITLRKIEKIATVLIDASKAVSPSAVLAHAAARRVSPSFPRRSPNDKPSVVLG